MVDAENRYALNDRMQEDRHPEKAPGGKQNHLKNKALGRNKAAWYEGRPNVMMEGRSPIRLRNPLYINLKNLGLILLDGEKKISAQEEHVCWVFIHECMKLCV